MGDRLPQELLCAIGCKLDTASDRIRFRAVSKSWRSAFPFRQPPWLLLLKEPVKFIIAGEQPVCKVDVPDIVYGPSMPFVIGCAGNWLNPFSKFRFKVACDGKVKVCLSSPPRCNGNGNGNGDETFTAVAYHLDSPKLLILRPGDASWTPAVADTDLDDVYFDDVLFYKGQFYAYIDVGKLLVCHIPEDASKPPRLSLVYVFVDDQTSGSRKHYLVEWSGELLMVVRFLNKKSECYEDVDYDGPEYETSAFKIYKFDFANMKFDELKCLGDGSLFLGRNTSIAVPTANYFGFVRSNCIYFADDWASVEVMKDSLYERRKTTDDLGVFSLEDNSITPHFKDISTLFCYESVWIIPA